MFDEYGNDQMRRPVVAVVTDREMRDGVDYETVRTRYLEALRETASVIPLLLPSGLEPDEVTSALDRVDGILLTGAMSNVAPALYGGGEGAEFLCDPARDQTVMAAIEVALTTGLPLLGICRGLQELNVALGGTLDPAVSESSDRLPHSEDLSLPRDRQYDPVHDLAITGNGYVSDCISKVSPERVRVNSLHVQGVAELSPALSVDAHAADGVIEAVSVKTARSFAAGVQWHPEWQHSTDEISQSIFQAFGNVCAQRKKEREAVS